jgi:hypothetical protein
VTEPIIVAVDPRYEDACPVVVVPMPGEHHDRR